MTATGRLGATVRLSAFCAGLVVAARVLVATGRGSLSIPLGSVADMDTWAATASPAEMAMAVVRLLAIAACGYLLAVTALGVAARVVRARGLVDALDRVSPTVVRRLVSGGTGAGLVLGTLVGSLPAPDLAGPPGTPTVAAGPAAPEPGPPAFGAVTATMARVATGTATMTRTPGAAPAIAPTPGEATMTRLDDEGVPTAAMTRVDEAGPSPQIPAATSPAVPVAAPTAPTNPATSATTALPATPALPAVDPATWLVEPGDSLWAIAEDVVRTARADASDRTVARYWRSLVEANRAQLVDPGNHDLLVPGQQLVLPPFAP